MTHTCAKLAAAEKRIAELEKRIAELDPPEEVFSDEEVDQAFVALYGSYKEDPEDYGYKKRIAELETAVKLIQSSLGGDSHFYDPDVALIAQVCTEALADNDPAGSRYSIIAEYEARIADMQKRIDKANSLLLEWDAV